jgi:benzoyl-CoA reductase/2-hydroxyglutaryl-CoA dehydratase subunit BcrC/BadD/HgdB
MSVTIERAFDNADRPLIGTIGHDVPVELIEASGGVPFRLRGEPSIDTRDADGYLGTGLDPAARSLFAGLLRGDGPRLAGIVVSSDAEASQRIFFALRELARVGLGGALPPVHLVDVLHLRRRPTVRYNEAKLREMAGVLAGWIGAPSGADDVEAAIAGRNAVRSSARRVRELRRDGRIPGTDFLELMLATARMRSAEAIATLDGAVSEWSSRRAQTSGPRVFLTGSSHDETGVYRAIEHAGAIIVGDDHDGGELGIDADVREPTLAGLAARYLVDATPQRSPMSARALGTAAGVRDSGASALLSYSRVKDDAPRWDFAAQAVSVPVRAAQITHQPYGRVDQGAIENHVKEWAS